ncbi:MAG: hypothetical protein WAK45_05440, partial [Methanoregula sp.]|uniref:hypothetical protein n=1 Tax=Methanoregula sp. TaxID=2052170 RepID=UPI003BAF1FEB
QSGHNPTGDPNQKDIIFRKNRMLPITFNDIHKKPLSHNKRMSSSRKHKMNIPVFTPVSL